MSLFSNLFGRKESASLEGFIDHHSHILPGVDDGFQTLEHSLKCLENYERYGFSELWLTPHIMEDFPNETADIKRRFADLQQAYTGTIKLHLASENMIDNVFDARLAEGDFLPMGDHLLVETSYYGAPSNFYEAIESIKKVGYFPLLAHPERYRYMDDSDYKRLLDMGVDFQLNMFSLVGMYGPAARERALYLLKRGAYKIAGSDIHGLRQLEGVDRLLKEHKLIDQLLQLKQSYSTTKQ